jgi:hypothetical protein
MKLCTANAMPTLYSGLLKWQMILRIDIESLCKAKYRILPMLPSKLEKDLHSKIQTILRLILTDLLGKDNFPAPYSQCP